MKKNNDSFKYRNRLHDEKDFPKIKTIPKKLSRSNIESLAKGFQRAAREFELKILGGDTNEGKELVITFSLFGISEKIVNRKGAKANHVIITSGPFGYSAAGLSILLKNKKMLTEAFVK